MIQALVSQTDKTISIDTYKPEVARQAIEAGASVINDVTGFRDPGMIELAARTDAACVVMHMRGTPADMMEQTNYTDVVADLVDYFQQRIEELVVAGVDRERIIIDPGIGFAKRRADNLRLIHRIDELASLGRPILLGRLAQADHRRDHRAIRRWSAVWNAGDIGVGLPARGSSASRS